MCQVLYLQVQIKCNRLVIHAELPTSMEVAYFATGICVEYAENGRTCKNMQLEKMLETSFVVLIFSLKWFETVLNVIRKQYK